jgi:glycerol uptake facilitator-like aquaporin
LSGDRVGLSRRLVAELVGTALLVTVVVGSGIAAQRLSPNDVGLQLFENSTATVFGLAVLILMLGPVSGAHFNPVVSIVDWAMGRRAGRGLSGTYVAAYAIAQCAGGVLGALLANVMFDLDLAQISTKHRVSSGHLVGEIVATAGLIALIFALARTGRAAVSSIGRRVHRRRLLVHQLHLVRQPGSDGRPHVLQHLRRHRPGVGARLRHSSAGRRCARSGPGALPLPRCCPDRGRRGRATRTGTSMTAKHIVGRGAYTGAGR